MFKVIEYTKGIYIVGDIRENIYLLGYDDRPGYINYCEFQIYAKQFSSKNKVTTFMLDAITQEWKLRIKKYP